MGAERIIRIGPDNWKTAWMFKYRLRALTDRYCRKHFARWGWGSDLRYGAYVIHPEHVYLGYNIILRPSTMLFADSEHWIMIGDNVLLGAGVHIYVNNHVFTNPHVPISEQGYTGGSVDILDNAWIGANSIILPGVTIGKGAVVGAGSVVTKNIPHHEVWAGNPARFIRRIDAPRT